MNSHKRHRGITLIEVIVTLAIILVLAAILLSTFNSAKGKANSTSDISKMKQLGAAGALYNETYGEFPMSTIPLVQLKMVQNELVASNLDPFPRGLANYVCEDPINNLDPKPGYSTVYKRSFIGPAEFAVPEFAFNKFVKGKEGSGWLIELSTARAGQKFKGGELIMQRVGPYKRLLFDTSVVIRQARDVIVMDDGKPASFRNGQMFFTDNPETLIPD